MADMGAAVVDELDLALIAALEVDGRASFSEIAGELGVSSEAARIRYLRLSELGLLTVVGVVNPSAAGLTTVANVNFVVHGDLDSLTAVLQSHNEVTFVAWSIGGFNIVSEIACENRERLLRLVYEELAELPGVVDVEVLEFMRSYKFATSVRAIPNPSAALHSGRGVPLVMDEMSRELVRLLHDDGRRPFTELAEELGRPYSVVRRRCQALFEHGVVQIAVVVDRIRFQREMMGSMWLRVAGNVDAALTRIADIDGVQIVVRTGGPRQAIVEAAAPDTARLVAIADEITGVPGISDAVFGVYTGIKKLPSQWRFDPR